VFEWPVVARYMGDRAGFCPFAAGFGSYAVELGLGAGEWGMHLPAKRTSTATAVVPLSGKLLPGSRARWELLRCFWGRTEGFRALRPEIWHLMSYLLLTGRSGSWLDRFRVGYRSHRQFSPQALRN
jgi:hypothetical protein